jgi:hypothetical protein
LGESNEMLTVVATGTEFELRASHDGMAFVLRSKTDRLSAHLKGDDAIRFRADYEAIKLQFPAWQADQTLAQLWDQGGYSWLAVEEAC